jgi:endonuclease VIII
MAEGDTVLRTARRIDRALAGQTVAVTAPNPRGRVSGIERLDGMVLRGAGAHGKNLLLDFGDLVLHSHLGMSGSWDVYPRGARWRKPRTSAWAVLRGDGSEAVQWGGPKLRLLRAAQVSRDPVLARLGPDVLDPDFDAAAAAGRMRSAAPDRQLGDALLDQGLVAGIGNIFKSEACFAARTNPWEPLAELPGDALERTLAEAAALMGSAVRDGRHPRRVYRQTGRPCPVCGTPIRSRGQGDDNRTTYWCPACQSGEAGKTPVRRG